MRETFWLFFFFFFKQGHGLWIHSPAELISPFREEKLATLEQVCELSGPLSVRAGEYCPQGSQRQPAHPFILFLI